jgi:hypothetical protein
MHFIYRFLASTGLGAVAFMLVPHAASAASNPIQIKQCFVTVPKAMSKLASGTQIVYVNGSTKAASHVTFTVAYRNSASHFVRKVTDDGNFAPSVTINHHFDLYSDVVYGGKHVESCKATSVKFADGTRWPA